MRYLITNGDVEYNVTLTPDALQSFINSLPGEDWTSSPIDEQTAGDPQVLLDARIAAGNRLVRQFVIESESWGLGAADSLAMLQRFSGVQGLLQLGRLGTARTLLRTLPTDAVFTAEVRQRYISELDALLS